MDRSITEWLNLIDEADNQHSPSRRADYADCLVDEIRRIFTAKRLEEVCKAEADGRLKVLPRKGDELYYTTPTGNGRRILRNTGSGTGKVERVSIMIGFNNWIGGIPLKHTYKTPEEAKKALGEV